MKIFVLSCALLILSASTAQAADTAAVAAALPDEASECRYLKKLCEEVRRTQKEMETQMVRVEKKKLSAEERETARQILSLMIRDFRDSITAVGDAATVIRAKHETMPSCFSQCDGVLDSKHFE